MVKVQNANGSVDGGMNKERACMYQMEYCQPYQDSNSVICSNMDGATGHDVKRNKVGVEKQIPHVLTYV